MTIDRKRLPKKQRDRLANTGFARISRRKEAVGSGSLLSTRYGVATIDSLTGQQLLALRSYSRPLVLNTIYYLKEHYLIEHWMLLEAERKGVHNTLHGALASLYWAPSKQSGYIFRQIIQQEFIPGLVDLLNERVSINSVQAYLLDELNASAAKIGYIKQPTFSGDKE